MKKKKAVNFFLLKQKMGTHTDSSSDSDFFVNGEFVCNITPEDIHKVLLEGYNIVTECHRDFACRKKDLYCLWARYRCLFNPYFPQVFKFFRDPLGFEYLILIGTVGNFAIDVVLYWDNFGWIVLNEGVCFRRYNFGGCSKLQYSVAQRKPLILADEKCRFEAKKQEIDAIVANGDFVFGPNTYVDWRFKPRIKIMEPCKGKKIKCCDFTLALCLTNWKLADCGKSYHVYIDGKYVKTVFTPEPIKLDLHHKKKGWHCLEVRLFDECCRYAKISAKTKFYLCKDCKCFDSSSSSSCSSSSSSSSSSTTQDPCLKPKHKFPCDSSSSSSSSSCSSSSSSDCCSSSSSSDCSSSSSSDCSSSSSKWKCKKVKKCSSSSSSSDCSSSSSSSDCSSSSSSSEWICKKKSSSSSSTTTCPSTTTVEQDFYCYENSYSCPSTCSSTSCSSSTSCPDPCKGEVKCAKRRKFKCPKVCCNRPVFVRKDHH